MHFFHIILGILLLLVGWRFYWLAVGILGLLIGIHVATDLLTEAPFLVQLLTAAVAGAIGAFLAVFFHRLAFAIGGFLAGAYLAGGLALELGSRPELEIVWAAIGGVAGAVFAALVMDWAIIALTSLVGAGAIVTALELSNGVAAALFLVLAGIGMAFQAWQIDAAPAEPRRETSQA